MDTEFKEKTFEKYFGLELASMVTASFSPDQCDEFYLGFDDAFFLPWRFLESIAPYHRRSRRSRMSGISIRHMEHLLQKFARHMPNFRLNLFIQYKRPKFLKSRGAKEWEEWKQQYYRYNTTPHQHAALMSIENQSRGRASVIYASPAFWESDDLYGFHEQRTIIQNSNIASAGRLNGHGKYSYVLPGYNGKGHSETEDISSPSIEEIVRLGMENDPLPLNQHLKKTAMLINEAINVDDIGTSRFRRVRDTMIIDDIEESPLLEALATISAFSEVYEISLYALG